MANDLKEADNVIINMSHRTLRQRITTALLHFKHNFGEDSDGFLRLNLSREDMANLVGTAAESCIRIISEFKQKGWIHTSEKRLVFRKPENFRSWFRDFKWQHLVYRNIILKSILVYSLNFRIP
ncbi:helix-turn-helix domain-containing protein [Maribacter cobaltidurans]|uniref:Helix-turn-helix domain-containing protein n=2 Tax=Flavobacteriaceae TaxID=49546 RepID=A0ABU7IY48_9FLAO|nr:helix-turn-helix domain-containing protein [Maribacter cobaltidurans]MEE1977858.1 helix-turn-helix domain-containing protein [Maribacter cobaltidurans]